MRSCKFCSLRRGDVENVAILESNSWCDDDHSKKIKAEAPKRHSGNALALNYISAKPSHPLSDQLVFTVITNRTQLWESLLAPPTTLGPSQELYR
jgi:hypothetical protein